MRLGTSIPTMKVGSTAVAAIKRGSNRVYDADVAAFQQASEAADVTGILDLVDYLKAESLWDYARFYPMKSSQNAGSGSTVYGLGGLTSNNMTLVNSPTWGSDGVAFDAVSSQSGAIADFTDSVRSTSFWWRGTATTGGGLLTHYDYGNNNRSVTTESFLTGSPPAIKMRFNRSSDGTSGTEALEIYNCENLFSGSTISVEWLAGGGSSAWINTSPEAVTLAYGTPQTSRYDASASLRLMASTSNGAPASFASGTVVLAGFIETALTTTQREAITDLINAL